MLQVSNETVGRAGSIVAPEEVINALYVSEKHFVICNALRRVLPSIRAAARLVNLGEIGRRESAIQQ